MSEERQFEVRRAVEDVMSFFDDRYGVVVPGFTMYISPDRQAAAARYTELTGREARLFNQGWEGGFVTEGREGREGELLAFLAGWWVTTGDVDLREILAHEYFHLMQYSVLRAAGVSRSSPKWITEGTARYNEELYSDYYTNSSPNRDHGLVALHDVGSFEDITESFGIGQYAMAALAISWLVTQSDSSDASLEYWRFLADNQDWRDAFESAFSITPEEFFEAFEQHRTRLLSTAPRIRGTVLDLAGNRLAGVLLSAAVEGRDWPSSHGTTADDGTFELIVPEGRYDILLARLVTTEDVRGFNRAYYHDLFYNHETGYVNECGMAPPRIAVGTSGLAGLEIRVAPHLLKAAVAPPCGDGLPGYYVIDSTVFGPDGEPVRGHPLRSNGVHVTTQPIRPRAFVQGPTGIGPDGKGRVAVQDGRYVLEITEHYFGQLERRLGWYGGETGFTTDREEATVIEVDGANVTGIEIHLPADPADLPTIE